jgi:hypothetical protein
MFADRLSDAVANLDDALAHSDGYDEGTLSRVRMMRDQMDALRAALDAESFNPVGTMNEVEANETLTAMSYPVEV